MLEIESSGTIESSSSLLSFSCIVGILTRKNLQTYLLHKNASLARIQAVFRGKLARIRRRLALEKLHAKKTFRLDSTSSNDKTDNSKKNE